MLILRRLAQRGSLSVSQSQGIRIAVQSIPYDPNETLSPRWPGVPFTPYQQGEICRTGHVAC